MEPGKVPLLQQGYRLSSHELGTVQSPSLDRPEAVWDWN